MAMSWRARSIVTTDRTDTIADGVAGRFPIPAVLGDLLAIADHVPLVEEESIVKGMRMLYRHAALVVEPSAAFGIAAILEDPVRYRGKRVVTVICGSNVLADSIQRMDASLARGIIGRRPQHYIAVNQKYVLCISIRLTDSAPPEASRSEVEKEDAIGVAAEWVAQMGQDFLFESAVTH
jgi:threonine dehydratase